MDLSNYSRSSGDALAHQLQVSYDISRAEVQAKHIGSVYKEMLKINEAADFSGIENIFASNPNAENRSESACGVIVETRKHPALETVVLNVIETCDIPVQVFHGITNLDYILSSKIAGLVDAGNVVLTELNINELDAQKYNALLLSQQFWENMIGRGKVLVFQTDSICCRESDYTIRDFLMFDYIGGSWNRNRPVGLVIDGGNGGFSLRDWNVSVDCLSRFPPTLWGGGEDGYYAFHMAIMGAKVASQNESAKFATQNYFNYQSFGAHAIYNLKLEDQRKFFQYCELAKQVFPHTYSQLLKK